jgi:glycosyltransferase involved in cell wall biosynthesis
MFITPSHFMAKQLNKMGFNHEINVIHNPINTRQIRRSKNMRAFQQTVLYAGRFSKDKGIELFLQAADKLKNIKFLIAGVGDLIDNVERASKELDNFEYLGSLNQEQLFDAFDRSDFLVLPSIWYENNPMIVIEAMTYGLAVIGSDIGGIPELLSEGRGFLFDPLKPGALPILIEKLKGISLEEYIEVTERARSFARTLSSDHYYENLCRLIPELNN